MVTSLTSSPLIQFRSSSKRFLGLFCVFLLSVASVAFAALSPTEQYVQDRLGKPLSQATPSEIAEEIADAISDGGFPKGVSAITLANLGFSRAPQFAPGVLGPALDSLQADNPFGSSSVAVRKRTDAVSK